MSILQPVILPKTESDDDVVNDLILILSRFFADIRSLTDQGLGFSDNMDCRIVSYTTNATPDTEDAITHTLGKIPVGYIITYQDKAGSIYDSGTAWTEDTIYLKCSTTSASVRMLIF